MATPEMTVDGMPGTTAGGSTASSNATVSKVSPSEAAQSLTALIQQTMLRLGSTGVSPAALILLLEAHPTESEQVIDAIKTCPTLLGRTLAVINSAAFGMSRKISDIDRAVYLLGPARARSVSLAFGLKAMGEQSGLPRHVAELVWRRSIERAYAAKRFCDVAQPELADEAYSLTLIQDIGLPMLMAVDPDFYTFDMMDGSTQDTWSQRERGRFGFDHAAVGQGLMLRWNASRRLQQAIQRHHGPPIEGEQVGTQHLRLAQFIGSTLPHLDESPLPEQVDWLHAIHAKFLAAHFVTPDAFLRDVYEKAGAIVNSLPAVNAEVESKLLRILINQVTSNAVSVTSKLCNLEQDLSRQQAGINDLKIQAFTDQLTKLLNRRGFMQFGERRFSRTVEAEQGVCCMLSDLDGFKQINDTYGHDAGDAVLRGLALKLRRSVGEHDLVGRLGGDEFVVLVTGVSEAQAREQADDIVKKVSGARVRINDKHVVQLKFSLGAAYCKDGLSRTSLDQLLSFADQAMYQRKRESDETALFVTKVWSDEDDSAVAANKHEPEDQATSDGLDGPDGAGLPPDQPHCGHVRSRSRD